MIRGHSVEKPKKNYDADALHGLGVGKEHHRTDGPPCIRAAPMRRRARLVMGRESWAYTAIGERSAWLEQHRLACIFTPPPSLDGLCRCFTKDRVEWLRVR